MIDGGFGSHFPVLAAAVASTTGPVLEMGCGWGSTPMLDLMCRKMDRRLVTVETQREYYDQFSDLFPHEWFFMGGEYPRRPEIPADRFRHEGVFEREWLVSPYADLAWGVAFVDFYPGEARKDAIRLLADKAKLIVVHDAEADGKHGGGGNYEYDLVTPLFKYVHYYRIIKPVTMVLSNFKPFEFSAKEQA